MAAAVILPILIQEIPQIPAIVTAIAGLFHKGYTADQIAAQLQLTFNDVKALDADAMATLAQIPTLPAAPKTA